MIRQCRKNIVGRAAVALALLPVAGCASPESVDEGNQTAEMEAAASGLAELTIRLHEDMLLRHAMTEFAEIASPEYMVMIPGGRLETKDEDIAGASNFDVESVAFSDVVTRTHGQSAVVTGVWSIVGQLGTQPMTGDYAFMLFYEWSHGDWVLVSESVTRVRSSMAAALTG